VSENDRLLIAGSFDEQDPDCIFDCVIALSLDGSISASFSMTGVSVKHMSLQHDGKILVTGNFSKINDHTTYYVGRIMPNGGADGTFSNTEMRYASMKVIRQRAGGKILVGGSWRWLGESASINRVAQLSSSGARDVSFDEPMFSSLIFALSVPSNFEFIVGGMFEIVNGTARNGLARFLMERPDPVFHNGFD
ncbi:MAG: delta-60 repeat domain-containing protein, partial [Dokdonella sp.]